MEYDLEPTAAQLIKLAEWLMDTDCHSDQVQLAADDRMLVAEVPGGAKMAWDLGGEPASDLYLSKAPLDPVGEDRARRFYGACTDDGDVDTIRTFAHEVDRDSWLAARGLSNYRNSLVLQVIGRQEAAEMIAEERDDA